MKRFIPFIFGVILLMAFTTAVVPSHGSNTTPAKAVQDSVTVVYADQTFPPGPPINAEVHTQANPLSFLFSPLFAMGMIVIIMAIIGFIVYYVYTGYLNPPEPPA
jgi:hypothetical protein